MKNNIRTKFFLLSLLVLGMGQMSLRAQSVFLCDSIITYDEDSLMSEYEVFEYDKSGQVVSDKVYTVEDAQTPSFSLTKQTEFVYDSLGHIVRYMSQNLQKDIMENVEYRYQESLLVSVDSMSRLYSSFDFRTITTLEYDEEKHLKSERMDYFSPESGTTAHKICVTVYDERGNTLSVTWSEQNHTDSITKKTENIYNDKNQKINETIYTKKDGKLRPTQLSEFIYNRKGKLANENIYHWIDDSWLLIIKMTNKYRFHNRLRTTVCREGVKISYGFACGDKGSHTSRRIEVQDSVNSKSLWQEPVKVKMAECPPKTIYDKNGNISEIVYYKSKGGKRIPKTKTAYTYDSSGHRISYTRSYWDGDDGWLVELRIVWTYDTDGNNILETEYDTDDEDEFYKTGEIRKHYISIH